MKNADKLVFVKYNIVLERTHLKKSHVIPNNNQVEFEAEVEDGEKSISDEEIEIEEIANDIVLTSEDEDFEE